MLRINIGRLLVLDKYLLGSRFNVFKSDKPLVQNILVAESASPLSDFAESRIDGGVLLVDDRYYQSKASFDEYDFKGNVGNVICKTVWSILTYGGINTDTR